MVIMIFLGNVQNAKSQNVKKKMPKQNSQNVESFNVKINIEIVSFLTFCTFLYHKKMWNHKTSKEKMSKIMLAVF